MWIMGQSISSASTDDTKLGGMIGKTDGCAFIQKDLNRLEM